VQKRLVAEYSKFKVVFGIILLFRAVKGAFVSLEEVQKGFFSRQICDNKEKKDQP